MDRKLECKMSFPLFVKHVYTEQSRENEIFIKKKTFTPEKCDNCYIWNKAYDYQGIKGIWDPGTILLTKKYTKINKRYLTLD